MLNRGETELVWKQMLEAEVRSCYFCTGKRGCDAPIHSLDTSPCTLWLHQHHHRAAAVNQAVKPVLFGKDCTPIMLGIGIGDNRFSSALNDGRTEETRSDVNAKRVPISVVHSVTLTDFAFLNLLGERCVQVTGEP